MGLKTSDIRDVVLVFWPSIVTVLVVPLTVLRGHAWVGVALLTVILFLPRFWWSCLFGLLNWMILVGGVLACLIPYLKMLRQALS